MDKRDKVEALQARQAELRKELDKPSMTPSDSLMLLRELVTIDEVLSRIDC